MILVKESKIKNGYNIKLKKVNTLVPNFQYINKKGEIVKPFSNCIKV